MRPATILGGAPQPEDPWRAHMRFIEERNRLKVRTLELAREFAAEDEPFRRQMLENMKQLGKGKRGAPPFEARLQSNLERTTMEMLKENVEWLGDHRAKHGRPKGAEPRIPTKKELKTRTAEILGAPSPDAVGKRQQRAKRVS